MLEIKRVRDCWGWLGVRVMVSLLGFNWPFFRVILWGLAVFIYTNYCHLNIKRFINAVNNILEWGMPRHPIYLWTLPMFHCNGWCFPWTVASAVGTNVCLRKVDVAKVFELMKKQLPFWPWMASASTLIRVVEMFSWNSEVIWRWFLGTASVHDCKFLFNSLIYLWWKNKLR